MIDLLPLRPHLALRILTHLLLAAICTFGALLPDHLFGLLYPSYQTAFAPKTVAAVYLAVFLALAARRVIAIRVLLVLFAFLQLVQFFHFIYFGTLISPQEVGLVGSEMDEITVSLFGIWPALVKPAVLVLLSYTVLWWLTGRLHAYRFRIPLAPTLLVLSLGVILPVKAYNSTGSQAFFPNPRHYSIKNTLYAVAWYLGKEVPRRFSGVHQTHRFKPYQLKEEPSALPANIVVVMGESLNPHHMGLFGYSRDTTPHLSALKGDPGLVYSMVYAGGVSTKVSVPSFFNLKREPHNVQTMYQREANLFKLAKSRGMHTWFLSTQTSNLATYADGGAVDHFEAKEDHWAEVEKEHDMLLVDRLKQVDFSKPNFVVLHERGSHSPYERYHPDAFRVFPEDTQDMNAFRINSYDNSILYSDHVHDQIIKLLRQRSKLPTYVIFTGDHGELLGPQKYWKSSIAAAANLVRKSALGAHAEWGHSILSPKTATVPFIVYAIDGDPAMLERARHLAYPTHYEVGRYIAGLLGYDVIDPNAEEGVYYANGRDIAGTSGYMRMQFDKQGQLVDYKVVLP